MPDRILGLVTPDTAPGTKPSLFFSTVQADLARIWGAAFHVGSTPPASAQEDDRWYDTTTGQIKRLKSGLWIADLALPDRVKLVSPDKGGHYQSLAAALSALGDRAAGDEYTLLVMGPLAETAQVVARSGVNVVGLPGSSITISMANNTDRVLINGKTNARWCDLRIYSAGTTSGTNSVVLFQGAVDDTFVMERVRVENLNTVGGCHGIRCDAPAAPLLVEVRAKAGPSATASAGFHSVAVAGQSGGPRARSCTFLGGDSAGGHFGGNFVGQVRGTYDYCEFRSGPLSTGNGAIIRDHAAPRFNYCRFTGGDGAGSTVAWGVQTQGSAAPVFAHSTSRGGSHGTGAAAWRLDIVGSMELVECSATREDQFALWAYASANSGRFQPSATDPYYPTSIGLQVATATVGATLDVGTTAGGNDVLAAAPLGVAGTFINTGFNGLAATARKVIAAGGYLYATVNGGTAADGSFTLHLHYETAYAGCNAIYFNTKGRLRIDGGNYVSNAASDALWLQTPTLAPNVSMRGGVLEALPNVGGTQMASVRGNTAAAPGTYPDLRGVTLVGPVVNFTLPASSSGGGGTFTQAEDVYAPPGWNDCWEAAKAAGSSAPAYLAFVGDSIMSGRNASNVMTTSFAALVRAGLLARGLPLHGDFFLVGMLSNGGVAADVDWPLSSGAPTPNRNRDWLLRIGQNPGAGGSLTFTTPYACTRVDVIYVHWNAKTAAWSYKVDGGASTNVDTTGSKHQDRLSLTGLSNAVHTVMVTAGSAANDMSVGGFASYADAAKGLGVARVHMPGDTGSFWAANLSSGKPVRYWSGLDAVGATHFGFPTQPHLAINNMLVNDVSRNPPPAFSGGPDQYSFAMERWIESVRYGRPDASILFVVPDYIDTTYAPPGLSGGGPNVRLYVDRVYRLARANKCAVANFKGRWGQYPLADTDVHPNDTGHLDMANKLLEVV